MTRLHYALVLVGAVAFAGVLTLVLSRAPKEYSELALTFSAVSSALGFFLAATQFVHGYIERFDKGSDLPHPKPRVVAFGLFTSLAILAAGTFALGVANSVQLLSGSTPSTVDLFYEVLLPLTCTSLFLLLSYKVQSVRMLDMQKRRVRELGRKLNDWRLPIPPAGALAPDSPATGAELATSYFLLLQSICETALLASSIAGHQETSSLDGLVAVLFLADRKNRHFVPAAVAGGTPEYRNALEKFRPPFLDLDQFRSTYNQFHRRAKKEKPSRRSLPRMLEDFRRQTRGVVSSTGIIYSVEKKLVFDHNLFTHCLVFRFEFLDDLPAEQQDLFRFKQLVGIPVTVFGRKVGVLLLLASKERMFYTRDKIYWIIGDVLGSAIGFGVNCGAFHAKGLGSLMEDAPVLSEPGDLEDTIGFINNLSPSFKLPAV